jgi:predicted PurR-regulated permease PerM
MPLLKKNSPDALEVTVTNRTVIRVILLVLSAVLLLLAIRQAAHALTLIFISFFLALALNAPVHWISSKIPGKRKGNRTLATAFSFLIVVVFLGLFLASIIPPLIRQTTSFVEAVPGIVDDLRNNDNSLGQFVDKYNLESQVDKISEQASEQASKATSSALTTVGRVGGGIVSLLTVLVITFMMLTEGPRWINIIRRLTPDEREAHLETLGRSMYRVIKGYVNGQVILAFIAAILILPVLVIMHVSYPFALVVVVFICGLIPMIGHTIGAIIVTIVALFTSPLSAIIVLGYYILYQQIENYAIQPKVQANTTDMSPLLVFVSVVIGVSFSGILGGLLAIPIAGCLKILVLDYLQRNGMITVREAPGLDVVKVSDLPKVKKLNH